MIAPPPPKTMTKEWEEATNARALEMKLNPITGKPLFRCSLSSARNYSRLSFVTRYLIGRILRQGFRPEQVDYLRGGSFYTYIKRPFTHTHRTQHELHLSPSVAPPNTHVELGIPQPTFPPSLPLACFIHNDTVKLIPFLALLISVRSSIFLF